MVDYGGAVRKARSLPALMHAQLAQNPFQSNKGKELYRGAIDNHNVKTWHGIYIPLSINDEGLMVAHSHTRCAPLSLSFFSRFPSVAISFTNVGINESVQLDSPSNSLNNFHQKVFSVYLHVLIETEGSKEVDTTFHRPFSHQISSGCNRLKYFFNHPSSFHVFIFQFFFWWVLMGFAG